MGTEVFLLLSDVTQLPSLRVHGSADQLGVISVWKGIISERASVDVQMQFVSPSILLLCTPTHTQPGRRTQGSQTSTAYDWEPDICAM